MMTKNELVEFELEVARRFEAKEIKGPIHLCSEGQIEPLLEVFRQIAPNDWLFCSYRSHFHALLHGIPREKVMARIVEGKSMNLSFPEHRFYTSAIVGGHLPIATGVALALKRKHDQARVWAFCGDMAATTGIFHESCKYAEGHNLPIEFLIEDNQLSCDSPTFDVWGRRQQGLKPKKSIYQYRRAWPHVGSGKFVSF